MREAGIEVRAVAECGAAEVADALTRSYEGYVVPIRFSAEAYERRFRAEHLDPWASRLFLRDGAPIGILLVARRGWTARIAALAFVPGARGQGLGRRVLSTAIDEARSRGDRALCLEVIETNAPAVRLYAALGFTIRRRLVGYRWSPGPAAADGATGRTDAIAARRASGSAGAAGATGATADAIVEIDPIDAARAVLRDGEPGLPWLLAGETLAGAAPPVRAFALGQDAFAAVSVPDDDGDFRLLGIVVPQSARRRGHASRLLRAIADAFPGRRWVVPAIVPEGFAAPFFARLGWERSPLAQFEMALDLTPASDSSS